MTVHTLLQHFCVSHSIPYKQGMNEVLAPFIYLQPPPKGSALPFALYDAFLFRYLERFLCLEDSSFLYKAFRLFHVLLLYHDPQLALHLKDQDFPPELYSPQWFVTLFSRSLPLPHTLRLWDMLIAVDDPAFTFFIGLLLLRTKRDELLRSDCDTIPEIIQNLGFGGEESIDEVVTGAVELYKATPRSMCRLLRLCCVSTTQLAVTPSHRSSAQLQSATGTAADSTKSSGTSNMTSISTGTRLSVPSSLEKAMAVQAARSSVMLNAKELVESLQNARSEKSVLESVKTADGTKDENKCNNSSAVNEVQEDDEGGKESTGIWGGISGGGAGSGLLREQFVIIDVRSSALVSKSGAGRIACAMNIDEEFLDQPDAFHAWLQHFDAARGCSICVIGKVKVTSTINF